MEGAAPCAEIRARLLQPLYPTRAAGGSRLRSRFPDRLEWQYRRSRITLMAGASCVVGDWGTSHLRLFLCDEDGTVLDSVTGPGAAHGDFANVFDSLVAKWRSAQRQSPTVLSGMVGSSIGWVQAPYIACPVAPATIATSCVSLRAGAIQI